MQVGRREALPAKPEYPMKRKIGTFLQVRLINPRQLRKAG